ncbi:MAG: hypothetical protein WBV59_04210 [Anaerolineae bacterium]
MSENVPSTASEHEDPVTQRWGWAVLIIAALLFAIERYIFFAVLVPLSAAGSQAAAQILAFLYGTPPYSTFDVLLGFQIPDEGLMFLLQPHNMLLGLTQAIHYGINLGLAFAPFWVLEKFKTKTQSRPLLRLGGCVVLVLALACLIIAGITCINSTRASSGQGTPAVSSTSPQMSDYSSFTDSEFGVQFEHPGTMVPQVTRDSRAEGGVTFSSITARIFDRREVTMIFFQAVDDPALASSPGWYPPSKIQLRIFAASGLGTLSLDQTPDNTSAIDEALDAASVDSVAGFPALTYRVFLNDSDLGYIYIRGAIIVTPARIYTLMAIGGLSAESPIHEPVKPERVDEIWSHLLTTIALER